MLSGNPKKTHTDQIYYSVSKETTHNPSKVATAKNVFTVYMLLLQIASIRLFFHVITGRHCGF